MESSSKQADIGEPMQGSGPPSRFNVDGKPRSGYETEYVTAAVSIARMEATAEASLARMRERRKLGTAIAEMIRITATTSTSSMRENPFWFFTDPPQADITLQGRGAHNLGPRRLFQIGETLLRGRNPTPKA